MSFGTKLSSLEKRGKNKYVYRGKIFTLNKPIKSTAKGKKMMVLATKTINGKKRVRLIHFGAIGYGHNYSQEAKERYLKRTAHIRNKHGQLTRNDPWSANHWARKILWPKNKPATGPRKTGGKKFHRKKITHRRAA
ncbi:MAG: hypothetical protein AAF443_01820 [Chlamydiota bacterium]